MDQLSALKGFHLLEFYFSLAPAEKKLMLNYCKELTLYNDKVFTVKTAAQLLWTTAANAIPDSKWDFAEKLLHKALELVDTREDTAWIHANLTQLYHDQLRQKPEYIKKCLYHCHQLLGTGYFTSWAENMLAEVMVMHIR